VADIFISYTQSDRDWAFWIGHELEALGHKPHIHEWQVAGGENIMSWMQRTLDQADHLLCVVSANYLTKPYSALELQAAQWSAITGRRNFVLPVFVEPCEPPRLLALLKRCDLHGLSEGIARTRLKNFLDMPGKTERPPFPGPKVDPDRSANPAPPFPVSTLSNIPIRLPVHFLGRDDAVEKISEALSSYKGRVAITALSGLRGIGKSTLAAAYAERHRREYRATWWISAQMDSSMRTDLVSLGVRLGWVGAEDKEEPALAAVMERLRHEGSGILLIYDNAIDARTIKPYLPLGGEAGVLVTSNADAFREIAEPVQIRLWPNNIGADYLLARTGRKTERPAAEALSEALGGLPLAHAQAAAYCENLGIGLAEYGKRFAAAKLHVLAEWGEDTDQLTVAGTFSVAIDQAAARHPAAEPLIVHAALLAPEPIPLFLFTEARKPFDRQFASALANDGLDKAVAALRVFALVDREQIVDERESEIVTDAIRLHRLVRDVAAARRQGAALKKLQRVLVNAVAAVCPRGVFGAPATWPRMRRLDGITRALIEESSEPPKGTEQRCADVLHEIAAYSHAALGDYARARRCFERALALYEKILGSEHPRTARTLNSLGLHFQAEGNYVEAKRLSERALAIYRKNYGDEHPDTAWALNSLGRMYQNVLAEALSHCKKALEIREKALGPDHRYTAVSLNDLAGVLFHQGNISQARTLFERSTSILEKALGGDHPTTNYVRRNLAALLLAAGEPASGYELANTTLAAHEQTLGQDHFWTKRSAGVAADALDKLGRNEEGAALRNRYKLDDAKDDNGCATLSVRSC
jgi:tetratricopeptide (TPR) repeat protein